MLAKFDMQQHACHVLPGTQTDSFTYASPYKVKTLLGPSWPVNKSTKGFLIKGGP